MVFKYDASKFKEYRQNGIFRALLLIGISIFLMPPILILTMKNIEFDIFIIIITTIVLLSNTGAAAGTVGIIIGYKRAKTEFESYQIECDGEKIVITSNMAHKEIKTDKIKKIFKDKKNNFYIALNKINKISVLHYIENSNEFEKYLTSISVIEQYCERNKFFEYIPLIFFIALMYISRFDNIELYLIFAILVLLTTVYSLIKLFVNQLKFKYKIISFIVNGIILYGVINGIYNAITYLIL